MRTQQVWTALACLAKDCHIQEFDDGGTIVNLRVLINEMIGGKEHTEGFNVEYRPPRASIERVVAFFRKALKKGAYVWVVGSVKTETYTDREGLERTVNKVRATTLSFMAPAAARAPATPADESDGSEEADMPAVPVAQKAAPTAPDRQSAPEPRPAPVHATLEEGIPFDDPSRW